MTIIELYQGDGFLAKRLASTHGGEWAGPCPWCGGRDRFRCWPGQGEAGKYWCRQCGRAGDAIQYLKDYRRLTYREACDYLGRSPGPLTGERPRASRPAWTPRACSSPGDLWQRQARHLIDQAAGDLFTPGGRPGLAFLQDRGFTADTAQQFRLGWLAGDRWAWPPSWGLPKVLQDNGRPKKLWIPGGLTIPLCQESRVIRVRIRRPEGDPRYFILRGSNTKAMVIGGRQAETVLVESELDAMLLFQEAGTLVNLVALGNAQARPDQETAALLEQSRLILVSLDGDPAGAKEAWHWWKAHYSRARRWPPIRGKDPGEMFQAGVNLRAWVEAGLAEYHVEV